MEVIWLRPMSKAPTLTEKSKKTTWQHKKATINFDFRTSADWLRTVSFRYDNHSNGVVKPEYGVPTFPLTAKAVQSKGQKSI